MLILYASGVVRPEMVTITDLNEERLVDLATRYGFATLPNDPQNEKWSLSFQIRGRTAAFRFHGHPAREACLRVLPDS